MRLRMIWEAAPHNAFTDLIRYNDLWYCVLREGLGHASDDGRARIIRSRDGLTWEPVALLAWEGGDVRDPKLSITPDGQLMVSAAVRLLQPEGDDRHRSVTWLSADGDGFSGPFACPTGLGTWRWSVTWHDGAGYSFGYGGRDRGGTLYRTDDGRRWKPVARELFPPGLASETSIVFMPDERAYCLLRRDPETTHSALAALGTAWPPYTSWEWIELGLRMGAPEMILVADENRLLAVARLYDPVRTSLCEIEPLACRLPEVKQLAAARWRAAELIPFPSGGDTSYAGVALHAGELWISYYSSHEGRPRVYLALMLVPAPPPRLGWCAPES